MCVCFIFCWIILLLRHFHLFFVSPVFLGELLETFFSLNFGSESDAEKCFRNIGSEKWAEESKKWWMRRIHAGSQAQITVLLVSIKTVSLLVFASSFHILVSQKNLKREIHTDLGDSARQLIWTTGKSTECGVCVFLFCFFVFFIFIHQRFWVIVKSF